MAVDQFQDSETVEKVMVTPYLPVAAMSEIQSWLSQGFAVFHRVVPQVNGAGCKNCGDLGVLYVTKCKIGPISSPRYANKSIVWFDGDGRAGKGWYVIDETIAYDCTNCSGADRVV